MVTIEILQSCSGVDFSYHQGQRVEVAPERAADLVKHQSAKYPDPVSETEQLRIKTEQEAAQTLIDEQRRELEEKMLLTQVILEQEAENLRVKNELETAQLTIEEQRRELDEKQAEFDRKQAEFAEQQRQFFEAQAAADVATIPAAGETVVSQPAGAETAVETTPPGQQTATAPKGAAKPAATKPS